MFDIVQFGKSIRILRINKGLTIYDLAIQTDMNYSSLSNFETGKRSLPVQGIINLVNFFVVTISSCLKNPDDFERMTAINQLTNLLHDDSLTESDREFLLNVMDISHFKG